MDLAFICLILVSVSANAAAQVMLRKAMLQAMPLPPFDQPLALGLHLLGNLWLWAGMGCFALSIGLWLFVLSRTPVSVAYPMASIGYIIAAVAGAIFLNESVGLMRAVGIAIICCGVVVVARSA